MTPIQPGQGSALALTEAQVVPPLRIVDTVPSANSRRYYAAVLSSLFGFLPAGLSPGRCCWSLLGCVRRSTDKGKRDYLILALLALDGFAHGALPDTRNTAHVHAACLGARVRGLRFRKRLNRLDLTQHL